MCDDGDILESGTSKVFERISESPMFCNTCFRNTHNKKFRDTFHDATNPKTPLEDSALTPEEKKCLVSVHNSETRHMFVCLFDQCYS